MLLALTALVFRAAVVAIAIALAFAPGAVATSTACRQELDAREERAHVEEIELGSVGVHRLNVYSDIIKAFDRITYNDKTKFVGFLAQTKLRIKVLVQERL